MKKSFNAITVPRRAEYNADKKIGIYGTSVIFSKTAIAATGINENDKVVFEMDENGFYLKLCRQTGFALRKTKEGTLTIHHSKLTREIRKACKAEKMYFSVGEFGHQRWYLKAVVLIPLQKETK